MAENEVTVITGPDACGLGKSLFRSSPVCFRTTDGEIVRDVISLIGWDKDSLDKYGYNIRGHARIVGGKFDVRTQKGTITLKDGLRKT